ncbi:MAG: hypothetical protein WCP45_09250 [Verrucomicrobiota bacterium]
MRIPCVAASLAILLMPGCRKHAGKPELVLLDLKYPPEVYSEDVRLVDVPNLVPRRTSPHSFLVPTGTTQLSKGKPVTSSDANPIIGELSLITDGEKGDFEGYYVELLEGLQWIQIDLQGSAAIHAICLWHYHMSYCRIYHDVIIRISDDPDFRTGVITVYNNDYDGSAKMGTGTDNPYVESRFGLLVDGKGTKGRYVRLYSAGNNATKANHYMEVEVYGIAR